MTKALGPFDPNPDNYQPDSGKELKDDGSAFDVTEWREQFVPDSHYRIHQGQAYSSHLNEANLSNGSVINFLMQTNGTSPHITFDVSGKFDYDFEVLEAPSYTGGSAYPSYNRRRSSTNVATATLLEGVTFTADGTIISSDTVAGGQKMGGTAEFDNEWILKPSTNYGFRLTSRANSNRVHLNILWYEPY
jgi:hypothetical protein